MSGPVTSWPERGARRDPRQTSVTSQKVQHLHSVLSVYINWGCPADLLTNQAVLDQKVHCHTSRAPPVGSNPRHPRPDEGCCSAN